MAKIIQTQTFKKWLSGLGDEQAKALIVSRLLRLQVTDNLGDHRFLSGKVGEMRLDHGPGYRVYFLVRGKQVYVLLGGGTKKGQQADIEAALALGKELDK